MKGQRTALQFIKECESRDIEGVSGVGKQKSNLLSLKQYHEFVSRLDVKTGHLQDRERKKKRIKLLELERYEEKGFLPKDLTQTSHLVRMAATELEKEFSGLGKMPRILSLPGSVTGEVRKGWKLYGCLAAHNPEVQKLLQRAESEDLNIKKELRDITHQHHALDACVIGYASHFIPNDGNLWEVLVKRNRRPDENELLIQRGYFVRDGQDHARLRDLSNESKKRIADRLAECRVVQHIPKKMGGLAGLEENTRGIVAIEVPAQKADAGKKSKQPALKQFWNNKSGVPLPDLNNIEGAIVHLQQYGPRDPKNKDKRTRKYTEEKAVKLLGLSPAHGDGKLRAIKGVRVVDANFGLALWRKDGKPDGEPMTRIILWHKVWPQLKAIAAKENGGKWPQVFRNGQIIHVPTAKGRSDYQGYWQIVSIKNNESGMAFDIIRPDMTKLRNRVEWAGINVSANTLVNCGMTVVKSGLTGVPLNM
jgi:CRISPR-associated endonuclease Csn1